MRFVIAPHGTEPLPLILNVTKRGSGKTRVLPLPVVITLSLPCGEQKGQNSPVKCWELVADKLSKAGWSLGWVSAIDSEGRTIWIVDGHRDDGKRFVVHADEVFTAFVALESAIDSRSELERRKLVNPTRSYPR